MNECSAYVGLDVHKDTIAVALPGREEPVYRGEIKDQRKSLLRLIRALGPNGELVSFCYEAGSCGYGVYREGIELKARQRLGAFLLRHGRVYREGKSRWTQKHFRWLEEQKFDSPVQ